MWPTLYGIMKLIKSIPVVMQYNEIQFEQVMLRSMKSISLHISTSLIIQYLMKQVSIVFYWGYLGPRMIFFVRHECHKVFFQPAAFTNIKWHIFYNSLLTYICLLKPCYRQMYWIRDNILTLTTHSYFDYSSGYILFTLLVS